MNIFATLKCIIKTASFSVVVLCFSAQPASGADIEERPDFAFPQTVVKEAEAGMMRSLASGQWAQALTFCVQSGVAEGLISSSNAVETALKFDSIANLMPAPYNGLAWLLEARTYADIYDSNRWVFDRRVIPSDSIPSNPAEWSGDIFSKKICSLVSEAMKNASDFSTTPLAELGDIATAPKGEMYEDYSVFDFMTSVSERILSRCKVIGNEDILPFGESTVAYSGNKEGDASFLRKKLLEKAITTDLNHVKPLSAVSFILSESELSESIPVREGRWELRDNNYLRQWIDSLSTTPYCAPLYEKYYSGLNLEVGDISRIDTCTISGAYREIKSYSDRYPDGFGVCGLRNLLRRFETQRVLVEVKSYYVSGSDIVSKITYSNIADGKLLLVALSSDTSDSNINFNSLLKCSPKVVAVKEIGSSGVVPFYDGEEITYHGVGNGVYAIVPSSDGTLSGVGNDVKESGWFPLVRVTGISVLNVTGYASAAENGVYVVSASDMRPVAGATVRFTTRKRGKDVVVKSGVTDKAGFISAPEGNYRVYARKGKDNAIGSTAYGNFSTWISNYPDKSAPVKSLEATVLTDLGVYRPGQEIKAAVVVYQRGRNGLFPVTDKNGLAILRDANYQKIDTVGFTTDCVGRAQVAFTIPVEGLLGSWGISIEADEKEIGQCRVMTADYKSPRFYVALSGEESTYSLGDKIRMVGKVTTYSGMPVSDAQVTYTVENRPMPWRGIYSKAIYSSTTECDSEGSFVITLDSGKLRDTNYSEGLFTVSVTATSPDGETQESSPLTFSVGERYTISADFPTYLDISGGSRNLSVKVTDIFGNVVEKEVSYRIIKDCKTVKSGSFTSPGFEWPAGTGCGSFKVVFSLSDEDDINQSASGEYQLTVYNTLTDEIPVKTPLWAPLTAMTVAAGDREVNIKIGSSYPGDYIYVRSVDTEGRTSSQWVRSTGKVMSVKIPFAADVARCRVDITAMHDFDCRMSSIMLTSERVNVKPEIKVSTFRDHLTPGETERFSFVVKELDAPLAGAGFMAVMSNRALDAVAPFSWYFNASVPAYWYSSGQSGAFGADMLRGSFRYRAAAADRCGESVVPLLNTYGGNFTGRGVYRMMQKNSAMKYAAAGSVDADEVYLTNESITATSAVIETSAAVSDDGAATDSEGNENMSLKYRNSECPLAFFKPMLTTSQTGEVDVDFEVPDYNGEWKLQLLTYDNEMRSDIRTMYSVASKAVMVSLNYPRFLRSNDDAEITATVYNNSDSAREISGSIEVIDPLTGKLVSAVDYVSDTVAPYGSRILNIEFTPGEHNILVVRATAEDGIYSDGEQYLFPVLPASRPIVSATTFYLSKDKRETTVPLPYAKSGRKSEFRYCDNPLWECLTALPGLAASQSENALSIAESLYASALSAGIVNSHPSLAKGISDFFSGGDTLTSALRNDKSFVEIALENTPWVNDANTQTLRMNRLRQLTDIGTSASEIKRESARLKRLQNADGGWSWCRGMESSPYITRRVVSMLAYLNKYGCLPSEAKEMLKMGVKYYDSFLLKEEGRLGKKMDYLSYADYLLVRDECGGMKNSDAFESLRKKIVDKTKNDWKKLDIAEKSNAARLLWTSGYKDASLMVLESLRQFASYAPDKGMWFDNLKGGNSGMTKLQVTAMALRAFSEIIPQSESVDALRQWLMLEKLAEDWGSGAAAADVVNSVITSMPQSNLEYAAPVIEILYKDGSRFSATLTSSQSITGNIVLPLEGDAVKSVTVRKNNSQPGWGGIISSYYAPTEEIKSQSSGKIKIERRYYTLIPSEDGERAAASDIGLGDKVRVTLTLKANIDMDYVIVTDDRAACLEPDRQISGYIFTDRLWMYKEVCNESVNFFIAHLPKGVYQISYDCHADREGRYNCGVSTAGSQYWPALVANSAGKFIEVVR